MKNVIGGILQELMQKEGSPSLKDFAKMMSLSTRTIYNIYEGTSTLTFDQVVKASEILNFDISEEFYIRTGKGKIRGQFSEAHAPYTPKHNNITVTLTVSGSLATYQSFPDLLVKVRNQAKELGFDIN